MKFVIEKDILMNNLSTLIVVCNKKNINNPILQNVKIEAINNQIILTTTDLDTTIKNNFNINVERQGSTTVPAQMLFEIVKKLDDGSELLIDYKENDSVLLLSSGKSKFKLPSLNPESFPFFEEVETDVELKIATQNFIKIIEKTKFAISNDESRYYLNGLFFHSKCLNEINYIAGTTTDGHKLSYIRIPQMDSDYKFNGIIIPKKTLGEIRKLLETNEEEIIVSFSKTKIKIQTSQVTLISKLIDADFPEYDKVIPYNNNFEAIIEKKSFLSVLNRISVIAEEKNKGVNFIFSNNNLKLIANTGDGGYGDEDMSIEYSGEEIQIGFNYKYILELMSQIEGDKISIKLQSSNVPILITDIEEQNNVFVLMPMKI